MSNWWSRLPLKNKLQIPIQLTLFVILLLAQRAVLEKFEERMLEVSRQKAVISADGVLNGLNMLMIDGSISNPDQRLLFVKKMGASEKVLELRVIRNKPVQDQYGIGLPSEQPVDEMDRNTLTSAKLQSKLLDHNGMQSLRVVVPLIARKEFRGTRCLTCHKVAEGAVNGAVSITLDVSDDFSLIDRANIFLWAGQLLMHIFLFFAIGWLISIATRPLRQAVVEANAVAQGDLTMDLEVTSKDEVGQLMQALKDMNVSLNSIIADELGRVLAALSRGDLTEEISKEYPGIFGQLKDDANSTVEQLRAIISQVKDATDKISVAAQEIAAGNNDLSQHTKEQASSLEETATSMQELTSTVRQNEESAKQANKLASSASDIAVKGGIVVGDVVQTMASISASSRKIVDIISVIDGIAFQTNILALNAAVEAAHAGEQGRGFAVVAGEVRNLAQRSAAAAREIKALIGDSVSKVDAGSRHVDQAGATMNEIVIAVKRVTDIMAEISAASIEQSAGIKQVNTAIAQMDEVTQQNAALVEAAAVAAESMLEQANVLGAAMSAFKLAEDKGHVRKSAAKSSNPQAASSADISRLNERKNIGNESGKDGDWKEF